MTKKQNLTATTFLLITYNFIVHIFFIEGDITFHKALFSHLLGSTIILWFYYFFELKYTDEDV